MVAVLVLAWAWLPLSLVLAEAETGLLVGPGAGAGGAVDRGRQPQDRWPIFSDPGSGCSCRRQSSSVVLCFDLIQCVRFPQNVSTGDTLYVRATQIAELVVGDLDKMHELRVLGVEHSREFRRVQPGVFLGMRRLTNLTLSFNPQLRHLQEDSFRGLVSLKELTLVKNGFYALADVIPALSPATLPSLLQLSLDENSLRHVLHSDFHPMTGTPLTELNLANCDIDDVHPESLLPLTSLTVLRLGENDLNISTLTALMERMVEVGVPLQTLDLTAIGVHGQPPQQLLQAIALSPVSYLVLGHNEMERLEPGSFPVMPNIRHLDLSNVDLADGQAGALGVKIMPRLRSINLSGNRLSTFESGFLPFGIEVLDLDGNAGINPGQSSHYFELGSKTFVNMTQLRVLRLSYNRVLRLTNESFIGLSNLRELTLKNASIYKLDVGVFAELRSLEMLNLEKNLFPSLRPLHQDMFLGLDKLRVLRLGSSGIKTLGEQAGLFRHLRSLTHLDLRENALAVLDGTRAFESLPALVWLDLSRNKIGSWKNRRLFSGNPYLRELLMAGNTLTYLSPVMIEDLKPIDRVDLSDNVFNCGCDFFLPILEWLRGANESEQLNITRLFMYKCLSPDSWRDRPIAEYMEEMNDSTECTPSDVTLVLAVAVPIGVLFVLVFSAATLAYRFRHHLRYWGSLTRAMVGRAGRDLTKSLDGELGAYSNHQYDAFVSYSNEDQAFVQHLVAALEGQEPYFKLCVYERDFAIGMAITEAVLGSVALSKRVLLVVSEAFARSQWCAWEAHIAHHQRLLSDDSLLIIRLGAVDDRLLTPTLRYLLKTRIYLEYDPSPQRQQVFWSKLRNALSPPLGSGTSGQSGIGRTKALCDSTT